jgi:hypothetical protein
MQLGRPVQACKLPYEVVSGSQGSTRKCVSFAKKMLAFSIVYPNHDLARCNNHGSWERSGPRLVPLPLPLFCSSLLRAHAAGARTSPLYLGGRILSHTLMARACTLRCGRSPCCAALPWSLEPSLRLSTSSTNPPSCYSASSTKPPPRCHS